MVAEQEAAVGEPQQGVGVTGLKLANRLFPSFP